MRWIATLLAALALALALASCTSTATPTWREPVLHIAQSAEPGSLDPLLLTGAPAEEIGSLLYSYLLRVDDRGTLVPDLALRVPSIANGDISADGMTIVYRLRSDVRWHDGALFSAADVIATYRAVMDPRNPVPTRLGFDRIRTIEAPNPLTVRVRLRVPFAPFLTYFFEPENYPILPAHVLAATPVLVASALDGAPIGTGPFRLARWKHGDVLELNANPTYFGGVPHIARLDVHKRSFNSYERVSWMPRLRSILRMPNNFVQTPN
jgi:peptide/nickel transport system substrate-binding protein